MTRLLSLLFSIIICAPSFSMADGGDGKSDVPRKNVRQVQIFGSKYSEIEILDSRLKGVVYYLVSGHGGPDSGAISDDGDHCLCEDEYAYDITLRIARNLMQHGALVYMITRDANDGIRDEQYLLCDKDETCWPAQEIPLSQKTRLKQRVDAINNLYEENRRKGYTQQRAIMLHIDSRSEGERVDMFFYHHPNSTNGRYLVTTMQNTIQQKYAVHQKGRGYSGEVLPRNLLMLRESKPVAGYLELGNLKNAQDQNRFLLSENRQAVANWLADGMMAEALSR